VVSITILIKLKYQYVIITMGIRGGYLISDSSLWVSDSNLYVHLNKQIDFNYVYIITLMSTHNFKTVKTGGRN